MATYTTLRNGSRGADVKKLQESLKAAGYNIGSAGADGIYGNQTAAAVKAYQQANGLSVDGIAGNQTLGKLYGGSTATPQAPTAPTTTPAVSPTQYKDSEDVVSKRADLEALLDSKPTEYKSSYEDMIAQITDKIMNREKFSYDLNGDALYQQYKDQFINQGKLAMQDTIGQAAAMTGGYGNSYAQSVGQQTYQGYLQQLNDKVPELYQLALSQYNQEGEDMYRQYGLLADREETDYGRYRDTVADWNTDRSFTYGEYRDAVGDSQWEASFGEQVRQYEQEYNLKVEEIEEAKRHNLISEDQAQQQINLAKQELAVKQASARASASSSSNKTKKSRTASDWKDIVETSAYYKENDDEGGLRIYLNGLVADETITGDEAADLWEEYRNSTEGTVYGPQPKIN